MATRSKTAAAVSLGVGRVGRKRAELLGRIGPHFARVQPRLQARKYIDALTSDLVKRNGWSIAEYIGDRTPDRCQRLLNRAVWNTVAVMGEVRRFVVEELDPITMVPPTHTTHQRHHICPGQLAKCCCRTRPG